MSGYRVRQECLRSQTEILNQELLGIVVHCSYGLDRDRPPQVGGAMMVPNLSAMQLTP